MDALTLPELRSLCEGRGLATSGAKSELIARLSASSARATPSGTRSAKRGRGSVLAATTAPSDEDTVKALFPGDYESLSMSELQDLCRKRSVPVGGLRSALVARLVATDPRHANVTDLIAWCRNAGLSTMGTTAELVERVQIGMVRGAKRLVNTQPAVDTRCGSESEVRAVTEQKRPAASTPCLSQPPTLAQLKDLCRAKRLSPFGSREDLMQRLRQHERENELQRPPTTIAATQSGKRPAIGAKRKLSPRESMLARKETKTIETRSAMAHSEEKAGARRIEATSPVRPSSPAVSDDVQGCYVVVLLNQSPSSTSSYRIDRVYTTKAAGNARAREVFYGDHPEKWTSATFEEHERAIRVNYEDELLALSVKWLECSWTVEVVFVPACPPAMARVKKSFVVCSTVTDLNRSMVTSELTFGDFHETWAAANLAAERMYRQDPRWRTTDQHRTKRDFLDGLVSLRSLIDGVEWRVTVYSATGGEIEATTVLNVSQRENEFRQDPTATRLRLDELPVLRPSAAKQEDQTLNSADRGHGTHISFSPPSASTDDSHSQIKSDPFPQASHNGFGLLDILEYSRESSEMARGNAPSHSYNEGPEEEQTLRAMSPSSQCFIVYSTNGYTPDGFHSYEPPEYEFFEPCATREDANNLVRYVFYQRNPWGWTMEDFQKHDAKQDSDERVDSSLRGGLLELSVGGQEHWAVRAIAVPSGPTIVFSDPSSAVVIYSFQGYPGSDGFHSPEEPEMEVLAVESSVQAANVRVRELFHSKQPYGTSMEELVAPSPRRGVEKTEIEELVDRDGMLTMAISPIDSKSWSVQASRVTSVAPDITPTG